MTFAHWDIAADAADLHEHNHLQEEVWNVVEGNVVLVIDGVERTLRSGAAAVVPANSPHSVRIVGRARVIVTDYPVRENLPGVARA
jgi:mannose-6-phosphate isomerase-like protein (cupin superfamily)